MALNPLAQSLSRTCRYGHGALESFASWFALTGVNASANSTRAPNALAQMARPTGSMLALRVWRCPVCGYVELQDKDL